MFETFMIVWLAATCSSLGYIAGGNVQKLKSATVPKPVGFVHAHRRYRLGDIKDKKGI